MTSAVKNCNCSLNNQTCLHNLSNPRSTKEKVKFVRQDPEIQELEYSEESDELNDTLEELLTINREGKKMGRLQTDADLMLKNRHGLRKFEPLKVNGRSLSGMSIGGFDIDIQDAARKASEIIPLPPSRLPIIFVDEELNFYHHFFQGMEHIIDGTLYTGIISGSSLVSYEYHDVAAKLDSVISIGYERSDTELTVLIKKILTSTFESVWERNSRDDTVKLRVVANLWGFQYIEPGMTCVGEELCMWISMCYSHYKLLWFNTFKLTTVPEFAKSSTATSIKSRSYQDDVQSVSNQVQGSNNDYSEMVIFEKKRRSSGSTSGRSRRSHRPQDGNTSTHRWVRNIK